MRRLTLALAIGSLIVAALMCTSIVQKPAGSAASIGIGMAYAAQPVPADDDDGVPLPDPACRRVCLTNGTTHYCGYGSGQIGCKTIVNNSCIYTLCKL